LHLAENKLVVAVVVLVSLYLSHWVLAFVKTFVKTWKWRTKNDDRALNCKTKKYCVNRVYITMQCAVFCRCYF